MLSLLPSAATKKPPIKKDKVGDSSCDVNCVRKSRINSILNRAKLGDYVKLVLCGGNLTTNLQDF